MSSYADRMAGYVDGVLSGEIVAGRYVRLAVERHRRDLKRDDILFDQGAADEVLSFIEAFKHVKGRWKASNGFLRMEPWQCFVIGSVFGWFRRDTGFRRFDTVYTEIARKNAKSTMVAPVGLYLLAMDDEPGAEVYSAATKMKQARVVFDVARLMARRNPDFRKRCSVGVEKHAMWADDEASKFVPLEAQDLDGLHVQGALIDEVHQHRSPEVWEALDQGRGARDQSLLWAITTAGDDIKGVCFEKRDYLVKVLEGIHEDDAWFGAIWTLDEGDDPFDETVWPKANPGLGTIKSINYMRNQARGASASPAAKGAFKRKHLNVWTAAGVSAFDMDGWSKGVDPDANVTDFKGTGGNGFTGVDIALKHDFSSVVSLWPEGDCYRLVAKLFATQATVEEDGSERLQKWAAQGLIHVTPGFRQDLDVIEAAALEMRARYGTLGIAYDPMFAAQMAVRWAKQLPEGAVVETPNTARILNPAFQNMIALVAEGRILHDGSPVSAWMIENTVVREFGRMQAPAKRRNEDKIDLVPACCMALLRVDAPEDESKRPPTVIPEGYFV